MSDSEKQWRDGDLVWYHPSKHTRGYAAIVQGEPRALGQSTVVALRDIEPAYSTDHHPRQRRTTVPAAAVGALTIRAVAPPSGGPRDCDRCNGTGWIERNPVPCSCPAASHEAQEVAGQPAPRGKDYPHCGGCGRAPDYDEVIMAALRGRCDGTGFDNRVPRPAGQPAPDLDALAALEAAATPGPWKLACGGAPEAGEGWTLALLGASADVGFAIESGPMHDGPAEPDCDGALIAATRNALPALIRELREWRAKK